MRAIKVKATNKDELLINVDQITKIEKFKLFRMVEYRVYLANEERCIFLNEENAQKIFNAIGNRL